MKKYLYIALVVWVALMAGCTSRPAQKGQGNMAARGFSLRDTAGERLLVIGADTIPIAQPIRRLAVTSATHVGMLNELGATACICAVANPELIYTPLPDGVVDLGDAYSISIEALARADAEAIMVSAGSMSEEQVQRIRQLGIQVIVNAEWCESTPLGRAEWIRMVGAIVGRREVADSVFGHVAARYDSIVRTATLGLEVMVGNNYRGTWYVPSGATYMGCLLRDGGAQYALSEDTRSESIPLTLEEVLTCFGSAEVWIGAPVATYAELAAVDEKHTWFAAYKQHHVYNWLGRTKAGGANDFWERGVVHPDEVLEDIIHMAHADTTNLVYAEALK